MDRMRRGRRIRIRLNKMASPVSIQAAFKSAISFSFAIQEEGFMGTPTNNNEHIHNSACLPSFLSVRTFIFRKPPCGFPGLFVPVVHPLVALQSLPPWW